MKLEIPQFNDVHILVVGDVMLDRYWEGGATRISPEAPVPVVSVEQMSDRPGGAGNVALNIAALGGHATLFGYTGDDAEADTLNNVLTSAGVTCSFMRQSGARTTTKLRVISRQQQLLRLDFEQQGQPDTKQLREAVSPLLDGCSILLLSDYDKGALSNPAPLINAARGRGIPVFVDPKGRDFTAYRGASVLTPNLRELQAVVGEFSTEAELAERGQGLIAALELEALLVTRSEQGMTLLRAGEPPLHFPARAREVYDVTGAGDTVVAILAAAVAAGAALQDAVTLANLGASIAVGQFGAAAVSAYELQQVALGVAGSERGVLTVEQLQLAVDKARSRGEKIVFTNGCFDLLHAGHVAYLEQAKALGQHLIVAVNDDASVKSLKGDGRPINAAERRMAVLSGLACVDWVVGFEQDTPVDLLQILRPDVLVKGGDYTHKREVVGWEIVEQYGGAVHLLGHVDGLSTSSIVTQIRSR